MKCDNCENELESWWTPKDRHPRVCVPCGEEHDTNALTGRAYCEPALSCSDPNCEVCDNDEESK